MFAGEELIVDAFGCCSSLIDNLEALRKVCDQLIEDLGLHVVGDPQWHQFPAPGGVTGLYLLRESHLTCHTFPEHGLATLNLYCCRPRHPWNWSRHLAELLGAKRVQIQTVRRGLDGNRIVESTVDSELITVPRIAEVDGQ